MAPTATSRPLPSLLPTLLCLLSLPATSATAMAQDPAPSRPRARDLGIRIGRLEPGPDNAITDVAGVRVGHCTLRQGENVRTGVTVVLPHGGDPFRDKVPAAVFVMNGFGKLAGSTQVRELGELESPIALTNTLSVGVVMDALVAWTLEQPGNESVRSVNAVVGETNDGRLNDIRGRHVTAAHVRAALAAAAGGPVAEGCVGAGTGTACFGWKGGIGTASRRADSFTVGALVQTNFGGRLTVGGVPVHESLRADGAGGRRGRGPGDDEERGSCMIVLATDAPLCARNLDRLGARAFAGMARTGASFANGSGDYAIAFSTAEALRIRSDGRPATGGEVLHNDAASPLFVAAADATEEAILNSLLAAETTAGNGTTVQAVPVDALKKALGR